MEYSCISQVNFGGEGGMSIDWFNSKHYKDETAKKALDNIEKSKNKRRENIGGIVEGPSDWTIHKEGEIFIPLGSCCTSINKTNERK